MSLGPGVSVRPVLGVGEIGEGADLGGVFLEAVAQVPPPVVLVVSSKVVSKALGLRVPAIARDAAARERIIAAETVRVVAERRAGYAVTQVVESAAGPIMAAAGVDSSNTGGSDDVLTLPHDADQIAAAMRSDLLARLGSLKRSGSGADAGLGGLKRSGSGADAGLGGWGADAGLGVVVSDTSGRPWRRGLSDFALGCAGVRTLLDHRGENDHDARPMTVTVRALADEIAAAADLVRGKADGIPAAVVTGLPEHWFIDGPVSGGGGRGLVRTGPSDWFALGHVDAVRAALGVPPGSADSARVGIRPASGEDALNEAARRVVALALHGQEDTSCDVAPDPDSSTVRMSVDGTDGIAIGRVIARLEVAAYSEDLVATPDPQGGRHTVVLARRTPSSSSAALRPRFPAQIPESFRDLGTISG